ncbi:MAG: hypothetical protein C0485_18320 [Pirellula sp.]|nr:hypothetical protein [Pirellula sp.]
MRLKSAGLQVLFVILLSGCGPSAAPLPPKLTLRQAAVFHPDQITRLVAEGAQVDCLDSDGNSPLWVAVRFSKPESVKLLLAAHADANARGGMDWTPLHCLSFCKPDVETARLLIQHGADPNAVESRYGETPLHYAVSASQSPLLVKLLIDAGANVNAVALDRDTPLQSAVAGGHSEIADILLSAGADPELKNQVGFRPIDQLNACPDPKAIQAVFRIHDADDQRNPDFQ